MTKNPSLGSALLTVLIVIAIFTFGLFSAVQSEGNKATGAAGFEKVTGMATATIKTHCIGGCPMGESDSIQIALKGIDGVKVTSISKADNTGVFTVTIDYESNVDRDKITSALSNAGGMGQQVNDWGEFPQTQAEIQLEPIVLPELVVIEPIITPEPETPTYTPQEGAYTVGDVVDIVWRSNTGTYTRGPDGLWADNTGRVLGDDAVINSLKNEPDVSRMTITSTTGTPSQEITPANMFYSYGNVYRDTNYDGTYEEVTDVSGNIWTDTDGDNTLDTMEDASGNMWVDTGTDGVFDEVTDSNGITWVRDIANNWIQEDLIPVSGVESPASSPTSPILTAPPPIQAPAWMSLYAVNNVYNNIFGDRSKGTFTASSDSMQGTFLRSDGTTIQYSIDYDENQPASATITTISIDGTKTEQQISSFDDNGQIETSTSTTYDKTGDATSYSTTENGITNTVVATYNSETQATEFWCDDKLCDENELKNNPNVQILRDIRHQSYRDFFSHLDFALTKFSGLSGFSSLIWSDDQLNEWRENVDELFASAYLGTEYWTSEICKSSIESVPSNVAMVETAPGVFQAAATISAERSPPVPFENETINITQNAVQYLYKISAYVKAVEDDTKFNIYVSSSSLNKPILNETKTINEGESFSLTGDAIIIKYSFNYYDTVCIVFESGDIPDTCNAIPEASGIVLKGTTGTTTTGGTTTSWEEW